MIYFDSAATSLLRPKEVAQSVVWAIDSFGSVGRGVYESSLLASVAVYETRERLAHLFGADSPAAISFSANATEAINIAVSGLLHPGQHAVTTAASHNSVLRPLFRKQAAGCDVSILPVALDGGIDYDEFASLFRTETRLAVITHASNLTGDIYDIKYMADICHDKGAVLIVDAAQTAGVLPISVEKDGIDVLAFTGHKSLFGPQGTGGLFVSGQIDIPSFKVGGSGTHSYDRSHPGFMPEKLEAGTLNSHGIAGLSAGLEYIEREGRDALRQKALKLAQRFEDGVRLMGGVKIYGGQQDSGKCAIVALNVDEIDSAAVSDSLAADYDICTRSGAHCAPLMHRALGTVEQGIVRFSFSPFNTAEEVDAGIAAIGEISARGSGFSGKAS